MSLSAREKNILSALVRQFITTAIPVSSSTIAQQRNLGVSSATVRSILVRLEDQGFISQPHISSGRVPETLGYRTYVDTLMKLSRLTAREKDEIQEPVKATRVEFEDVLKEINRILAHLSNQLGVIVSPTTDDGVFERMELIRLSAERMMVVVSISSGVVRTIKLEISSSTAQKNLELINRILNERLSGMLISKIRQNFKDIVKDIRNDETGLMKILARRVDRVFDFGESSEVYLMGTHNIIRKEDFTNVDAISTVMELLENREVVVHLLKDDDENASRPVNIRIGEEIDDERMQECAIITTHYEAGGVRGMIGLIGPRRMNYSKLVALVDYTARIITGKYGSN